MVRAQLRSSLAIHFTISRLGHWAATCNTPRARRAKPLGADVGRPGFTSRARNWTDHRERLVSNDCTGQGNEPVRVVFVKSALLGPFAAQYATTTSTCGSDGPCRGAVQGGVQPPSVDFSTRAWGQSYS
jgi:hypothetical protein